MATFDEMLEAFKKLTPTQSANLEALEKANEEILRLKREVNEHFTAAGESGRAWNDPYYAKIPYPEVEEPPC